MFWKNPISVSDFYTAFVRGPDKLKRVVNSWLKSPLRSDMDPLDNLRFFFRTLMHDPIQLWVSEGRFSFFASSALCLPLSVLGDDEKRIIGEWIDDGAFMRVEGSSLTGTLRASQFKHNQNLASFFDRTQIVKLVVIHILRENRGNNYLFAKSVIYWAVRGLAPDVERMLERPIWKSISRDAD